MDKKDVIHTYSRILLSHKKELNNVTCSNMDATRDYHTKWGESEKNKYHMRRLNMWNLIFKRVQKNLFTK